MTDTGIIEKLIHRYFRLVDSCSFDELSAIFHTDIVYERPGYEPIIGLEALIHFYTHTRILDKGTHTLHGLIIDGNRCACWGQYTGHRRDGVPVDERFADIYQLQDERIIKRTTFFFQKTI